MIGCIIAYQGYYDSDVKITLEACQQVSDAHNAASVQLAFRAWLHLLDDSPIRSEYQPTRNILNRFVKAICSRPFRATVLFYKQLADDFIKNVRSWPASSITGEFDPRFMETPIAKEYLVWRSSACPRLFRYIYNFCGYLKKAHYVDPDLESTALRSWIDGEERLGKVRTSKTLLSHLRIVIGVLVGKTPPIRDELFHGSHGPGSTAEKLRCSYDKNAELGIPEKVRRSLLTPLQGLDIPVNIYDAFMGKIGTTVGEKPTRTRFVAKDVKTARTIGMESVSQMFWQQSVMRYMYRLFRKKLGKYIPIEDQTINMERARQGSLDGEIDTLDLSSASDSVSASLVKAVMPKRLGLYLFGTRTATTELPNGGVVKTLKFAPMGSATCFPTQCLIFLGLGVLAGMYWSGYGRITKGDVNRFLKGEELVHPTVYGDDITCDSRVTRILKRLLYMTGFIVNKSKSFTGFDGFRESCGGHYYLGHDVTPVLYRVKGFTGKFSGASYSSILEHINALGDIGYTETRKYLIHVVKDRQNWLRQYWYRGRVAIPFSNVRNMPAIYTTRTSVKNDHLRTLLFEDLKVGGPYDEGTPQRKCVDWQCDLVKILVVRPKSQRERRTELDNGYDYYRWWYECRHTQEGDQSPLEQEEILLRRDRVSLDAQLATRWIRREQLSM